MSTEVALRNDAVPALVEEPAVLASRAPDPVAAIEFASQCASLLKGVLVKQQLITRIQGRDHVNAEGWTLLAAMTGYSPRVAWSRKVDPDIGDGWEACVELVDSFGHVASAAEAMALKDEGAKWSRQEYSVRSMAQTRATSRAIRLKLGYIVTMAGYSATAAEEMPAEGPSPSATPGARGAPARGRPAGGASANQPSASSHVSEAPPAVGNQGPGGSSSSAQQPVGPSLSPGKAEFVALMGELGIRNTHGNRTRAIDALKAHTLTSDDLVDAQIRALAKTALRMAFGIKQRAELEVDVPSASEPGKTYKVKLSRVDDDAGAVCECEWFKFHWACKHCSPAWLSLGLGMLASDTPIPSEPWDGIDIEAVAASAQQAYERSREEAKGKRTLEEEAADRAWADSEPKDAA